MMSKFNNRIATLAGLFCFLSGCLPSQVFFDANKGAVNRSVLKDMPALLRLTDRSIQDIGDTVEIYKSEFEEKYIEKDDLLEISDLNTKGAYPSVGYDEYKGYRQRLFLVHFTTHTTGTDRRDGMVFFSEKYDVRDVCIGLGPIYLGLVNPFKGTVEFLYELKLTTSEGQFYLASAEKTGALKRQKGRRFPHFRIMFHSPVLIPDGKTPLWTAVRKAGINVDEIVNYGINKIGGSKPVIFRIADIMGDEKYLLFQYSTSITQ